jgi:hypothetical protein
MLRGLLLGAIFFGAVGHQTLVAQTPVTQSVGSLAGTVVGDDGKVLAAAVTANRTGQPPASGRAMSGADGTFTIANLPAGTYRLCAAVKGRGYLDPCAWSPIATTVQVGAGQAVTGFRLIVKKGATVQVRLNDAAGVLSAVAVPNQPTIQVTPHVLIGVVTPRGLFTPLVVTSKDATGRTHEGTIPLNAPVRLEISGSGVAITDAAGAKVDANGSAVTVQQSSSTAPQVLTYNITGAKP